MDQCSRHDTPAAVSLLTDGSGHDLALGVAPLETPVLTDPRLGGQPPSQALVLSH